MAASLTAPGRTPHSVHVYYVRAGDAREPVDIHVDVARDGGTLSTRQITARQNGQILLEALASFSTPIDSLDYYQPMPDVADPETLPPIQEQLADYADELDGHWVRPQPFDLRYVDAPPRLAVDLPEPTARMRMWWRPNGSVGADEVLHSCLLTYLSGTTMVEAALARRRQTPIGTFNALIDHALWFHRPVDLSDWVLSDQVSPSGIGGRGLRRRPCTTGRANWSASQRRSCTSAGKRLRPGDTMADPIETLMRANLLEVFNERDDAKRRAAIERTYAPDVRWTDAEGVSTGRDVLEAKCVALQTATGGTCSSWRPSLCTSCRTSATWPGTSSTPTGSSVTSGFDVALINDGAITDLFTVLNTGNGA